jgi:hypothetical protein
LFKCVCNNIEIYVSVDYRILYLFPITHFSFSWLTSVANWISLISAVIKRHAQQIKVPWQNFSTQYKLGNFCQKTLQTIHEDGRLTLTLVTWRIWWAPNNASSWQVWFNSSFKGLILNYIHITASENLGMRFVYLRGMVWTFG